MAGVYDPGDPEASLLVEGDVHRLLDVVLGGDQLDLVTFVNMESFSLIGQRGGNEETFSTCAALREAQGSRLERVSSRSSRFAWSKDG